MLNLYRPCCLVQNARMNTLTHLLITGMPAHSKLKGTSGPPTKPNKTQPFHDLKLAHINIQGLLNRLFQLKQVLGKNNSIDLLALSETWEN